LNLEEMLMNQRINVRPRILIIEDNPERIEKFQSWLQHTRFLPMVANSGGQAVGMFRHGTEGVAGICLDHDLNSNPRTESDNWVSGSDVVQQILMTVPKYVPILVHSMNTTHAPRMVKKLNSAGFSVTRIRMVILDEARFMTWLSDVEDNLDN